MGACLAFPVAKTTFGVCSIELFFSLFALATIYQALRLHAPCLELQSKCSREIVYVLPPVWQILSIGYFDGLIGLVWTFNIFIAASSKAAHMAGTRSLSTCDQVNTCLLILLLAILEHNKYWTHNYEQKN
jgi:hypothetical protein